MDIIKLTSALLLLLIYSATSFGKRNHREDTETDFNSSFVSAEINGKIPSEVLSKVYTDCILELSFSCLQKKTILFLRRLNNMKRISLFGNVVSVIRKVPRVDSTDIVPANQTTHLKNVIDNLIDEFFEDHILRIKVPSFSEKDSKNEEQRAIINIDFSDIKTRTNAKGRKKLHRKRGLKRLLTLLGLFVSVKMSVLMLGVLGIKAMKALLISVVSITISKMLWLAKNKTFDLHDDSSKGGGSSSGHRWDRTIQETATSSIAYIAYSSPSS